MSAEFEQAVREILSRTDLQKLISEYVHLSKRGATWWGLCPFHAEKTPSFSVNPKKGLYYCFGCQAGGNAISFLKQVGGLSGRDAVARLAAEAGVELPESAPMDPAEEAAARERNEILRALGVAQEYFLDCLYGPSGEAARAYLAGRGLDGGTVGDFGLGYGGNGDGLTGALQRRGVTMKSAEQAGLISPSRSGHGYYERFRGRVTCPVYNNDGAPIAFSARVFLDSDDGPKYLNSPETAVFHKGNAVFGLYQARQHLRQSRRAIFVEGNFDVISLHCAGVRNVVAPLGTALTQAQVRQIARFTDRITIFFDGDEAGRKASRRAVGILLEEGADGTVVSTPAGEDPDSMVRSGGAEAINNAVQVARPMVSWVVDSLLSVHGRSPHGIRAVIDEMNQLLSSERDRIRYGLYREEVARLLGVDVRELKTVLKSPGSAGTNQSRESVPVAEAMMMKLIAMEPALLDSFLEKGGRELLASGESVAMLDEVLEIVSSGMDIVSELVSRSPEPGSLAALMVASVTEQDGIADVARAFDDTCLELKIAFMNRKIGSLRQAMMDTTDEDLKMQMLGQLTDMERELKNVGPGGWKFRGSI
ncbi:DNA primase [Myxococcota bacterium]|nr:DNA primase [Myxococcota bacterium]